jgi:hypothetical protein
VTAEELLLGRRPGVDLNAEIDVLANRAGYFTRVVIEAVLLARFGSLVVDETVTVLVIVVFFAMTVTLMLIGLVAPLGIVPRLQLTVPDAPTTGVTQLPWLGVADKNVDWEERTSLRRT